MRPSLHELTGATLGLELFLSLVLTGAAGWWLDQKVGTSPTFTFLGALLGLAAGMRSVFRFATSSAKGAADPGASRGPSAGSDERPR